MEILRNICGASEFEHLFNTQESFKVRSSKFEQLISTQYAIIVQTQCYVEQDMARKFLYIDQLIDPHLDESIHSYWKTNEGVALPSFQQRLT